MALRRLTTTTQMENQASYMAGYLLFGVLMSKLCKMMDEGIPGSKKSYSGNEAWTKEGVREAVRIILSEKNTLFESMIGKLNDYPELNEMLKELLFTGKSIAYNAAEFIKEKSDYIYRARSGRIN